MAVRHRGVGVGRVAERVEQADDRRLLVFGDGNGGNAAVNGGSLTTTNGSV